MKKRLWHTLLCAGVALAAGLTAFTMPASADRQVVTVKLVSGEIITVTVDVAPGTPASQIPLPADLGPVEWVSAQPTTEDAPPPAPPVTTPTPPTTPTVPAPPPPPAAVVSRGKPATTSARSSRR